MEQPVVGKMVRFKTSNTKLKKEIEDEVARRMGKSEEKKKKPLTPEQGETLKRVYYNPASGYGNLHKFWEQVKLQDKGITYQQVDEWMRGQNTVQANAKEKKPKVWNSIVAPGPGFNYQMDLIDYNRYKTKDGYGWILVIIDVNSRKVGARALKAGKTKKGFSSAYAKVKGEDYLQAYKDIIEKDFDGQNPRDLNCDKEFIYVPFVSWVKSKGTKIHYSERDQLNKNAIVERFNGTIALQLNKHRFSSDDIYWPDYLQPMVQNYNNSIHSTIKAKPDDVWNRRDRNKQKVVWLWNRLEVGDKVRKKLDLGIFAKGDELRYSQDIYVIEKRKGTRFRLKNLRTGEIDKSKYYKESQLKKVNEIVENPAATPQEKEEALVVEKEQQEVPVKKELQHTEAQKQLKLNRKLKKFSSSRAGLNPHDEVEEDPSNPGEVRYVVPKRLIPKEEKRKVKGVVRFSPYEKGQLKRRAKRRAK